MQRRKVTGTRKVRKNDSNSSGKCTDENGDDNVNGDGNGDSDSSKVIQPQTPTKRLEMKSKNEGGEVGENLGIVL